MKEEMKKKSNEAVDASKGVKILDDIYGKALTGIPKVNKPVEELAEEYLQRHSTREKAVKSLISTQLTKCGTSGFLTGLGGLITLPVAIPANVGSVIYVQLRMIAAIAYMGGYDIHSDQVQTLCYVCLAGSAASDVLKQTGIRIGEKVAESTLKKIPGKILTTINQRVGFRLFTKFGTKGAINLVKLIPMAGGGVGAIIDVASTKIIAANAYKLFIGS